MTVITCLDLPTSTSTWGDDVLVDLPASTSTWGDDVLVDLPASTSTWGDDVLAMLNIIAPMLYEFITNPSTHNNIWFSLSTREISGVHTHMIFVEMVDTNSGTFGNFQILVWYIFYPFLSY